MLYGGKFGKYHSMPDTEWVSACWATAAEMLIMALALFQSGGIVFYRVTTQQVVDGVSHTYYHTEFTDITKPLMICVISLSVITLLTAHISRKNGLGVMRVLLPVNVLVFCGILSEAWLNPTGLMSHFTKILIGMAVCLAVVFLVQCPMYDFIFYTICMLLILGSFIFMIRGLFNMIRGNGSFLTSSGSLQPCELFKLLILLLSVSGFHLLRRDVYARGMVFTAGIMMAVYLLVVRDLGNLAILALLLVVVVVKLGLKKTLIKLLGIGGAAGLIVFVLFRQKIMNRLSQMAFYPVTNYLSESSTNQNLRQAILSLVRGGLLGTGVSASDALYAANVSAAETDFVFLASTSIFGIAFAVTVILSLLVLTRNVSPSGKEVLADHHNAYQSSILCAFLLIQAIIHVAGSASLIPMTGVTFPYLSRGGSSLLVCFAAAGCLVSFALPRERQRAIRAWWCDALGMSEDADEETADLSDFLRFAHELHDQRREGDPITKGE